MVTSRLDYCNSLLFGIASRDISTLQHVQNCLARTVTRSPPRSPSIPLLHSLHWLPVAFRIQFKINLLVHKTLSSGSPSYLYNLLAFHSANRSLRSNDRLLLSEPRTRTRAGARAFSSCAPALWNRLPYTLRSTQSTLGFHTGLKTHLFRLAFPP